MSSPSNENFPNSSERPEDLPATSQGHYFPSGDNANSTSYTDSKNLLEYMNTYGIGPSTALVRYHNEKWFENASPEAKSTYQAAEKVVDTWIEDTLQSDENELRIKNPFKLGHFMVSRTKLLLVDYLDFSEDLEEMTKTEIDFSRLLNDSPDISDEVLDAMYLDRETEHANRAMLFGHFAWQTMQKQHPYVARAFHDFHEYNTSQVENNPEIYDALSKAGMGLVYTLTSHTRIQKPLQSITGLNIITPSGTVPATDALMFRSNGWLAPERKDYNWHE